MKTIIMAALYGMIGIGVTAALEKRSGKDFDHETRVAVVLMWPGAVAAIATYAVIKQPSISQVAP